MQNNWVKEFGLPYFNWNALIEQTAHGQGVPSSSDSKMLLVLLIVNLKVRSWRLIIFHLIFTVIAILSF